MKQMVVKPSSLKMGLPKTTTSLCPECRKVIDADIFERDGKVMISKTCKEHGFFEDVYWSDVGLYLKAEEGALDGTGVDNPRVPHATACPDDCGLCNWHTSHTALANLDLTNRCNLKCPVCFANANAAGYVYEPTADEITKMMKTLRAQRPVPTTAIQFSGGEPTLHPEFLKILSNARDLGFSQVQIATNGITSAKKPEFAQQMVDAGLHTAYLQFDGLRSADTIACRGRDLTDIKRQVVKNFRNVKPKPLATVLVPTILNTINDDQVGPILDFAIENSDVVKGVNYQPVAFTGRIDLDELKTQRFTLPDLVHRLVAQTDIFEKDDFFPIHIVAPISYLTSKIFREPKLAFTNHPHCGLASYLFINEQNEATPVTRFVDVRGMTAAMMELADSKKVKLASMFVKKGSKDFDGKKIGKLFSKYFGEFINENKMPEGLDISQLLSGILVGGDKSSVGDFAWRTMFVGGMHFQDLYNYDIERLKRCNIHYVTPDQRIIPFCAYNGGPFYREAVEKQFSVPISEWKGRAVVEDW